MLMEDGSLHKMIKDLKAIEILDSRGNPTVEVSLFTDYGVFISAVPSGASTGMYEAKELRDGGERYAGKGVLGAIKNINEKIAPLLIGKEIEPLLLDKVMLDADGTKDKSNLGANAILGVSMSIFRAAAAKENKPLYRYIADLFSFDINIPRPCFNVINGGAHSGGGVRFQEFMIVPKEESFAENLRAATEFLHKLKVKIKEDYGPNSVNIGDEGGFVPNIQNEEEVLKLLNIIKNNIEIIIDVAASEFFKNGLYNLHGERKTKEEMIEFYRELVDNYNIIGLEDPLEENDFSGWGVMKKEFEDILIVGDDLLVTNIDRIKEADKNNSCNAMILKVNQIGSITEAVASAKLAKELNWKIIVSHRSGETNDDFIADFAVGIGAEYIKSGAPQRGERVAKYNKLLKIEKELTN